MAEPIIEVGGGLYDPIYPSREFFVFRNGVKTSTHPTFEAAMRRAFPDWEPQGNGHEATLDNF